MNTRSQDSAMQSQDKLAALIDSVGWGLFFVWVGIALAVGVGWGVALMVTGVISLGGQMARQLFKLKVDRGGLAFGACLTTAGLVVWLDIPLGTTSLPAWLVPAVFILIGVGILISTWTRKLRG